MIEQLRESRSEEPIKEIWKHLRFFLDKSAVFETIKQTHDIRDSKQDSNIKKQAEQIGFCIEQAEQYFNAAATVNLSARPVLLYYGAVALTRALTLLKLDGNYSIDALRKQKKHKHHGLELIGAINSRLNPGEHWSVFFERTKCRLFVKEEMPWGHFAVFCMSLVPSAMFFTTRWMVKGKTMYIDKPIVMNSAEKLDINKLVGRDFSLLGMLQELPELQSLLSQFGITSALRPGNVRAEIVQTITDGKLTHESHCYDFFVNAISANTKKSLLGAYVKRGLKLVEDMGPHLHLRFEFKLKEGESTTLKTPDIVNDLVGTKYFVLEPSTYIQEEVKYLMILYSLGMLSRYYPDVWIKALRSNTLIREITDSLLSLIDRKLPNLVLDQLTGVKHYIHS